MERLLADAQKISGQKYDINNLNDVFNAIHVIQGELDITGTTAKEAKDTLEGSFNSMKASAEDFMGALALGMDIQTPLSNLITTAGTFLFNNLIPMVFNIISSLAIVILEGIPRLIDALNPAIDQVFAWLRSNFPRLMQEGTEIVGNLILGLINAIPELLSAVGNLLNSFVQFLVENREVILESGKNLFFKLVDGIISVLPKIGETAIKIIFQFVSYIGANLPEILQSGMKLLTELITGIINRLPMIASTVLKLIGLFLSTVANNLPKILSMGVKLIVSLIKGLVSMFYKVGSAMGDLGRKIINSVKNIDLFSAGKAIIDGFLRGLKNAFGAVKKFVGGIGSWIAKHKGPISYDRKLLVPAGKAIIGGLNRAMVDSFTDVKKNVLSMASDIYDGFNISPKPINLDSIVNNDDLAYRLNSSLDINSYGDYKLNKDRKLENLLLEILNLLKLLSDKDDDVYIDGEKVSLIIGKKIDEYKKRREIYENRRRGVIL